MQLKKALEYIYKENGIKPVLRQTISRKLKKWERQGRLSLHGVIAREDREWAYRIFTANRILGDFSWWGWEARSELAWKMEHEPWFYPKWDGQKKVLVVAEQGLGDEILFISCAKDLAKEADVFWEVDSRLIPLLERSIPEVHWISRWKDDGQPLQPDDFRGDYDAFLLAGAVPKLFRRSRSDFPQKPYLIPEITRTLSGVGYVSKAGDGLHKRADVPGDHDLHHHSALYQGCKDFDEYVSLIASLDYINAVPSAVAHLCGAMGKRCNVILPDKVTGNTNTYLRWPYPRSGAMNWYGPHVEVFASSKDFYSRLLKKAS